VVIFNDFDANRLNDIQGLIWLKYAVYVFKDNRFYSALPCGSEFRVVGKDDKMKVIEWIANIKDLESGHINSSKGNQILQEFKLALSGRESKHL